MLPEDISKIIELTLIFENSIVYYDIVFHVSLRLPKDSIKVKFVIHGNYICYRDIFEFSQGYHSKIPQIVKTIIFKIWILNTNICDKNFWSFWNIKNCLEINISNDCIFNIDVIII